jgi:lipoprotein-anchoring transpeptidase ErfK/SrfK
VPYGAPLLHVAVLSFTAVLLATSGAAEPAAASLDAGAERQAAPRTQELAVLTKGQTAMARPDNRSARLRWVERKRPITRGRTVLPVIGHRTGANGVRWLRVRLPGRPNNSTGWIRKARTVRSQTAWQLRIDLSERRVRAYHRGRLVQTFSSVIGSPATPTPRGRFFVEENVQLTSAYVGGPYALALSARSYVLQEFAGGPGQIAVHGVWNVGGRMGTAASHGCIRLETAPTTWLGERIGPGVPVTITA